MLVYFRKDTSIFVLHQSFHSKLTKGSNHIGLATLPCISAKMLDFPQKIILDEKGYAPQ